MLLGRCVDPDRAVAIDRKKNEHGAKQQLQNMRPRGQHFPSDYGESAKRYDRGQSVESFNLRVGGDS